MDNIILPQDQDSIFRKNYDISSQTNEENSVKQEQDSQNLEKQQLQDLEKIENNSEQENKEVDDSKNISEIQKSRSHTPKKKKSSFFFGFLCPCVGAEELPPEGPLCEKRQKSKSNLGNNNSSYYDRGSIIAIENNEGLQKDTEKNENDNIINNEENIIIKNKTKSYSQNLSPSKKKKKNNHSSVKKQLLKLQQQQQNQEKENCDIQISEFSNKIIPSEQKNNEQLEQNINNNNKSKDQKKNSNYFGSIPNMKLGQHLQNANHFNNTNSPNFKKRERKAVERLMQKMPGLRMLPKNEIFILSDNQNKDFVMAKITEKKLRTQSSMDYIMERKVSKISNTSVEKQPQQKQNVQSFINNPHNNNDPHNNNNNNNDIDSSLDYLLSTEDDNKENIVPLKLAQYIAQRCQHFSLVLDACCGVGGVTLQLARTCDMCLALDINQKMVENANKNFKKYQVQGNIECIGMSLMHLQHITVDLVFLHPSFEEGKHDLFKNSVPNLPIALNHCHKLSKNIILLLPIEIDLKQIPNLFYNFYKSQQQEDLNSYTIEIERITYNNKLQYYLVYYGKCANLEEDEETQFLLNKMSQNSSNQLQEQIHNFLHFLNPRIGVRGIIKYINKSEKTQEQNQTILQRFLDLLVEKKILSREEIKENFRKIDYLQSEFKDNQDISPSYNSKQFLNSYEESNNDMQINMSQNNNNNEINNNNNNNNKINSKNISAVKSAQQKQKSSLQYKNTESEKYLQVSEYSDYEVEEDDDEDDESESDSDFDQYYEDNAQKSSVRNSKLRKEIRRVKSNSDDMVFNLSGKEKEDLHNQAFF